MVGTGRIATMLSPAPAHDKRRPCLIFALLLVTLLITGCADFKPFTPLHPGEALQGDKEIFTGRVVLVPKAIDCIWPILTISSG
jgi:hypothetical protein